jgi:hypothetical protein
VKKPYFASGSRWPYWFYEMLKPMNYWYSIQHMKDRLTKGYSDRDTFSLDWYLSDIISKAVLDVRDKGGYFVVVEDFDYDDEIHEVIWANILTDISDGFALLRDTSFGRTEEQQAAIDWAKELFVEHYEGLWW